MKRPIRNAASATPELYLYDEIGPAYWGLIDAKMVIDALEEFKGQRVVVRINSPGGSVFEANAIYNALSRHPGGVDVEIDALAASAASYIAMAGKRIGIAENAMMMIHNAWTIAIGNANDLRETAALLDKMDATITDMYAARSGTDREQIASWSAAETWFTAKEAVEAGLADEISLPLQTAANLGHVAFRNAPKPLVEEGRLSAALTEAVQNRSAAVSAYGNRIRLARRRA